MLFLVLFVQLYFCCELFFLNISECLLLDHLEGIFILLSEILYLFFLEKFVLLFSESLNFLLYVL